MRMGMGDGNHMAMVGEAHASLKRKLYWVGLRSGNRYVVPRRRCVDIYTGTELGARCSVLLQLIDDDKQYHRHM